MAIVTEISWNDMFAGKVLPDSPARKAFREAVEAVADKARAKLPELNTRVDKAVQIVLNGDISIDANGEGTIASQSNGNGVYAVGKGDGCLCRDHSNKSPKAAPKGLCKHILAYHIYTRARALAREKLEALDAGASKPEPTPTVDASVESQPADAVTPVVSTVPTAEAVVQSEPEVSPIPLPEAPASVNCHIMVENRQVMVTLRGTDETVLLTRLATLLKQYPVAQPPTEPPTQGTGSRALVCLMKTRTVNSTRYRSRSSQKTVAHGFPIKRLMAPGVAASKPQLGRMDVVLSCLSFYRYRLIYERFACYEPKRQKTIRAFPAGHSIDN